MFQLSETSPTRRWKHHYRSLDDLVASGKLVDRVVGHFLSGSVALELQQQHHMPLCSTFGAPVLDSNPYYSAGTKIGGWSYPGHSALALGRSAAKLRFAHLAKGPVALRHVKEHGTKVKPARCPAIRAGAARGHGCAGDGLSNSGGRLGGIRDGHPGRHLCDCYTCLDDALGSPADVHAVRPCSEADAQHVL